MPLRAYSDVNETKPVVWIGSAKDDLVTFPEEVVRAIGFALYEAQKGSWCLIGMSFRRLMLSGSHLIRYRVHGREHVLNVQ